MSSFKDIDLFGSGPHRFALSPQGEDVVPNYILGGSESGSSPVGTLELDITVTGRLVAASEAALWTLRDAITAQLADPPTPGTLIDNHAHEWEGMSLIAYAEPHPTDRGRAFSVEYKATFRRFNS